MSARSLTDHERMRRLISPESSTAHEGIALNGFAKLGIRDEVVEAIRDIGWKEPTPVQIAAIPVGLEGKDFLAQAQTGTGKTGTYGSIILSNVGGGYRNPSAVVIVPTRELALQVYEELTKLSSFSGHVCLPVYGGTNIETQAKQLRAGCDIVVCTPGRARDMIVKQAFHLSKVSMVVLDEADRMLDMGFAKDLDFILSKMPRKRQTMLCSATMPAEVKRLALDRMRDPVELMVSKDEIVLDLISQYYLETDRDSRKDALCAILDSNRRKTMVFCQTKRRATQLSRKLERDGYPCGLLHGDVVQNKRERTIRAFKEGTTRTLVATDVAARGLDIDDVGFVVNYDMTDPETYVHRIGRTGRAGSRGISVTFVLDGEMQELKRISRITGKPIEPFILRTYDKGAPKESPVNGVKSKDGKKPKSGTSKSSDARKQAEKAKERKKPFVKISIDIGKADDLENSDVCEFIRQSSGIEGRRIGRIIMEQRMTYVEVDPDVAEKVCKGLSGYDLDDRPIHANVCQKQ